jgi:hypothetical protein
MALVLAGLVVVLGMCLLAYQRAVVEEELVASWGWLGEV